jgi:hypothetical protein
MRCARLSNFRWSRMCRCRVAEVRKVAESVAQSLWRAEPGRLVRDLTFWCLIALNAGKHVLEQ